MANILYPLFKEKLLTQANAITFGTDTIKLAILKSPAAYNSAHDFYDDVNANVVTGHTPYTLAGKTMTLGVFNNSANALYTAVSTGQTLAGAVLYKDTGTPSTSPLIAWLDTLAGAVSITTITSNGGDITLVWDTGSSKIFAL